MPTWVINLIIQKIFEKGFLEKILPILLEKIIEAILKQKKAS